MTDCPLKFSSFPPEGVVFAVNLVRDNDYLGIKYIGDGRYAAIVQFMFTCAIIIGRVGDEVSYDDRWCYHNFTGALEAFLKWDGTDEPTGWHRHPGSGRRVADDGTEYINP